MKKEKKELFNSLTHTHVYLKNKKAITLIALIITIVIMFILASVAISVTIGENGIITKAKYAVNENLKAKALEEVRIFLTEKTIEYCSMENKTQSLEDYLAECLNTTLPSGAVITYSEEHITWIKDNKQVYMKINLKNGSIEVLSVGKVTKDKNAPTIEISEVTTNSVKLTIKDEQGKVTAYAKLETASNIKDNEWIEINEPQKIYEITLTNLSQGKIYYLWAKDDSKNIVGPINLEMSLLDTFTGVEVKEEKWVGTKATLYLDGISEETVNKVKYKITGEEWKEYKDGHPEVDSGKEIEFKITDGYNEQIETLKYTPKLQISVTYNSNGGTGGELPTSQIIGHTETVTIDFSKVPTRTNYTFLGWSTDNTKTDPDYTSEVNTFIAPSTNVELSAIWEYDYAQVTIGGSKIELTQENFRSYMGKVVTNYKTSENGKEKLTIDGTEYTVSTTYRLYYIDYANKYNGGEGAIYLKADDCAEHGNVNTGLNIDINNTKMKELNPELYRQGVTSPSDSYANVKGAKWLTDISSQRWGKLKESGNSTPIGDKVKYVVGAPSLEMMIDSYNTYYDLKGTAPDTSFNGQGRTKIYYLYQSGSTGYSVGPGARYGAWDGYLRPNTIKRDESGVNMYYPINIAESWLSSPSVRGNNYINISLQSDGGTLGAWHSGSRAFCPLVCLDSSTKLILE